MDRFHRQPGMIRIFAALGEFAFWLLWPDTFACVLFKRAYRATGGDPATFAHLASCDNVRQLEEMVLDLEERIAIQHRRTTSASART